MSRKTKFIPDGFSPPAGFETRQFRVRKLTIQDVDKDYQAIISSIDHLSGVFGPNNPWPPPNLTLEQNLTDLKWHEDQFDERKSFAYTVVSLDEKSCIGCVYFYPIEERNFEANIYFWVSKVAFDHGIEDVLFKKIRKWVKEEWPFDNVFFPHRDK